MLIKTLPVIALTAALGLTSGTRSSAQTTQATPVMQTAQPPQSAQPAQPIQPPTSAPTLTQPAQPVPADTLPAPVTAPVAPPTLTDPDLDTAVMMLNRIQGLTQTALGERPTDKLDKPTGTAGEKPNKMSNSGTVQVDRATLDEIRALAGQVAAMIPAKRQP